MGTTKRKHTVDPAHMQDIFHFAKKQFLESYSYFNEEEYDNMVTQYFRRHYTKEEMESDLPLNECCPAVQKAYEHPLNTKKTHDKQENHIENINGNDAKDICCLLGFLAGKHLIKLNENKSWNRMEDILDEWNNLKKI